MDPMNGQSPIVGDLVTNTAMMVPNTVGGYWIDPWVPPPPPLPVVNIWPSITITTAPPDVVHHMAFPLKAGAKSPCGASIVEKTGTTGLRASPEIDSVTCLACLRALAKR